MTTQPIKTLSQNAHRYTPSVTPQHALHQIPQRSPEILPTRQPMLVNKQHVMLETGVQVRLQAQLHHHRVVMAVNMRIDTVQALEDLSRETGESFGEGDA